MQLMLSTHANCCLFLCKNEIYHNVMLMLHNINKWTNFLIMSEEEGANPGDFNFFTLKYIDRDTELNYK